MGHLARFWGESVPGGVWNGTPGKFQLDWGVNGWGMGI